MIQLSELKEAIVQRFKQSAYADEIEKQIRE